MSTSTDAATSRRPRPAEGDWGSVVVPTRDVAAGETGEAGGRGRDPDADPDTGEPGAASVGARGSLGESAITVGATWATSDATDERAASEEVASPGKARMASRTASRISAALGQRSTWAKARARSTSATTGAGTSASNDASVGAGFVAANTICSWAVDAWCTERPVISDTIVAPTAHTSVRPLDLLGPTERLLGGHERGGAERHPAVGGASSVDVAKPRDPEVEHLDLPVARHHHVRRLDVAVDDVLRVGRGEHVEQPLGHGEHLRQRESAALPITELLQGRPLEQLHHEECRPVLRDVVVEHRDGPRVLDRVRDVALAHEARTQPRVHRQLGVQHLHRDALLVPVRGRVDGGHAPDAQQAIESVLAVERLPDPGAGARFDVGFGHPDECRSVRSVASRRAGGRGTYYPGRCMGRRRVAAITVTALVAALVGAVACEQALSIDGTITVTPHDACGLPVNAGSCQSCIASKCCGQASACAADSTCAIHESCLLDCGGDYVCRDQCQVDHPEGTSPHTPALDQCVASACNDACGMTCGLNVVPTVPSAAAPCATCLGSRVCSQALGCGTSLQCDTLAQCLASCSAIDCHETCLELDDGGTFSAVEVASLTWCLKECKIGEFWACAGGVVWPELAPGLQTPTFTVVDSTTGEAIAGATVAACDGADRPCAAPLAQGTTNAAGKVTFTLPTQGQLRVGFQGYFDVQSPGEEHELFFLTSPLPCRKPGSS